MFRAGFVFNRERRLSWWSAVFQKQNLEEGIVLEGVGVVFSIVLGERMLLPVLSTWLHV